MEKTTAKIEAAAALPVTTEITFRTGFLKGSYDAP